ncbi:helix-turn-helix transcriptional regulator [Pedobacter sp. HDW13]|uniref:helix-turn-helix domain-containing protein n=1 Tax=Pedobacter sp. HDW13 TaxID=2714940 RepID=UPI00140BA550|nr:helix-turn-helix domain-containing protein [Pedobacter sp. HDW13]QIL41200.1 helix-turn-helix transcriptional regulator [Pedobacter sp. HDW13]
MIQSVFEQNSGQPRMNEKPKVKMGDEEIAYEKLNERNSLHKTINCTYFIIVLFSSGSGTHSIDDVDYTIGDRQLHFLFPGQRHHWETERGTEAQKIVVGKKVFETFSSNGIFHLIRHNLHPVFKLDQTTFFAVDQEFKKIENELHLLDSDKIWKKILSVRMDIIAAMIAKEAEIYIKESVFKNANIIVKNFWLLANQHFTRQKNVSWYADQLHVGASYLNYLCKKHLNVGANQVIGQRILLDAKKQLRFSEQSIKEIAYSLGFKDVPSFSNFFREKSGFTPSAYRE